MPTDLEALFQGFTEEQKQAFLRLGTPGFYGVQETIVKAGEKGRDMLVVQEGLVSAWVQDFKVGEVTVESVLGASTLIDPHTRTVSLVAETEVRMLRFARPRVLAYFETVPAKLFQQFFVNAFRLHLDLIRRCEERIVQLTRELDAM